jgi:hypothetical protein
MKRILVSLLFGSLVLLPASPAEAEFRLIDLTVFGMD